MRKMTWLCLALAAALMALPALAEFGFDDWEELPGADVRLEMSHQDYDEATGTIMEIPCFVGNEGAAVRELNAALEALYAQYAPYAQAGGCEVRCYPVSGSTYVNVLLAARAPGLDDALYGFVYDREQDRSLSVQEALELLGRGEAQVREAFAAWAEGRGTLGVPELVAFRAMEDGTLMFYLSASGEAGQRRFFTWKDEAFAEVALQSLVPAVEVDPFDPPLRASLGE